MKRLHIFWNYFSIRLFYILLIVFILFGAYIYSVPEVKIGSFTLINHFYSSLRDIPVWLYTIDYFTFIFIIVIFVILGWILLYSSNKQMKRKDDKLFHETYIPKLFEYLFQETEFTEEEKKDKLKQLSTLLNTDHLRRLFIKTLLDVRAQSKGIIHEKTLNLMTAAKLNYLIKAYINSPHTKDRLFALKTIGGFQLSGYEKQIKKLEQNKNIVLRNEATVTLLQLDSLDNLLTIIQKNEQNFTLWDLNTIIKTIKNVEIEESNYEVLIGSENSSLSALGIILARRNNQTKYKKIIQKKINHPVKLVKDEAFLTLIQFLEKSEDFKFLIENFPVASRDIQQSIIRALVNSPDKKEAIIFLKWVIENASITKKVEALRVLLEIDVDSISQYQISDNNTIREACLQVLDINL